TRLCPVAGSDPEPEVPNGFLPAGASLRRAWTGWGGRVLTSSGGTRSRTSSSSRGWAAEPTAMCTRPEIYIQGRWLQLKLSSLNK
ncbi:hypothetical protein NDU88_001604, partial [Pleurodeles waltl]